MAAILSIALRFGLSDLAALAVEIRDRREVTRTMGVYIFGDVVEDVVVGVGSGRIVKCR